jgi:hypothetical protein
MTGDFLNRSIYYIFYLFMVFILTGCMRFNNAPALAPTPELVPQVEAPPLLHIVKSPKETLGLIAEWYTGNFNNWTAISNYNGKSGSSVVRLGENIFIPQAILVREDALKLHPQIKQQKSNISRGPSASSKEEVPAPIVPIDDSDTSSRSRVSTEMTPSSNNSDVDELDLDKLSEMVDLYEDDEKSIDVSETSIIKEVPSPPFEITEPSNIPLEIDEVEKRRIQLLQELLRK